MRFWNFLKRDGDHEWHMIDGTIIRAHKHAAGARGGQDKESLGRSCGGFTCKIHAKVDGLGMPLNFIITPGQAHDIGQAENLIGNESCDAVIADRGYDSDPFRHHLLQNQIQPIIPGRKSRLVPVEYDKHTYKERNAMERFFGRMKEYRGIATRYNKTAVMFRAGLVMAAIIMWLKL